MIVSARVETKDAKVESAETTAPAQNPRVRERERRTGFFQRLILPTLLHGYLVTLRTLFRKPYTVRYPDVKWIPGPRFRGYPKLVQDENGLERCVACGLCAAACPPKAIWLQASETEREKERYPVQFEIHMGRCINCGYCEEACPKAAIEMSKTYEMTATSLDDLIFRKEILLQDELPYPPLFTDSPPWEKRKRPKKSAKS